MDQSAPCVLLRFPSFCKSGEDADRVVPLPRALCGKTRYDPVDDALVIDSSQIEEKRKLMGVRMENGLRAFLALRDGPFRV